MNSSIHKLSEHCKGSLWLVHWDHVSSFVNSQEFELSVFFQGTSSAVSIGTNTPIFVFGFVEVFFSLPITAKSPLLTTSPVADEIFISRVNKNFKSTIVE